MNAADQHQSASPVRCYLERLDIYTLREFCRWDDNGENREMWAAADKDECVDYFAVDTDLTSQSDIDGHFKAFKDETDL
ncbi:hypothetical protein A3709_19400 [Halioglobus sp. HI00S01]|uniref:hypothetical protein n=1 Tax=Halioglobus sp. HI00S01 TaxID=1822214 RepID=UPI0007C3600A|nr:hypothetical protein [Halioglobus sp. HI00S01]KZX57791.1 hypothetical protein A3709_19400 [Halioglobus sp. HI00S01]